MMSPGSILERGKQIIPERSAWIESFGLVLFFLGVFLGLSCSFHHSGDYLPGGSVDFESVSNLAGPAGAWASGLLLGYFGLIGILWPLFFIVWGGFVTLGFVLVPEMRRFLGFLCLTIVMSWMIEVEGQFRQFTLPHFGYGGLIGAAIAGPVKAWIGYAGSHLLAGIVAIICLVLTGNLAISRTAAQFHSLRNQMRNRFLQSYRFIMRRGAGEEDLIREALAAAALESAAKKAGKDVRSAVKPESVQEVKKHLDQYLEDTLKKDSDAGSSNDGKLKIEYDGPNHGKPTANLFSKSSPAPDRAVEFEKMARKLTAQLEEFKIEGTITKITEGPVVTTFEFEPKAGTKVSKITAIADDLARMLQAKALRILAPIPGKQVVGFEVPNSSARTIGFADFIEHADFKSRKMILPVAFGLDSFGSPVIEDLTKMPHLLVAGSTGSGKSVFMNSLIGSLIARYSAKELRFVMVDPKMVELASYNDLPHMAAPVVTDPAVDAKEKLQLLVAEMEDRFQRMQMVGARNLEGFNEIVKKKRKSEFPRYNGRWQPMPFIVLIIDELADMMMVLGKDAEVPITRLAQKARAAGIHLVIATQRPSADVVTGLIKANFPTRVAFRVLSAIDSRTILDRSGAEKLLGRGDMLYLNSTGCRRIHGAYLSDEEVRAMAAAAARIR